MDTRKVPTRGKEMPTMDIPIIEARGPIAAKITT
jgi:hypothetical protein